MEQRVSSDFAAERRLAVTPELAGWTGLTFRTYGFHAGHPIDGESVDDEVCMLFLAGSATVRVDGEIWDIEGRSTVFSGLPHCIYLPPHRSYLLSPRTDCEVAYARMPAQGRFAPRFIPPGALTAEERGAGNTRRQVTTLPGAGDTEHLLCLEARTPAGNWSDCPVHEQDTPAPGREATLAEVCYHRIEGETGWALQRLRSDDGAVDEAIVIQHGDAVMVRQGYHPAVAAPGHALYTLRVLAHDATSADPAEDK